MKYQANNNFLELEPNAWIVGSLLFNSLLKLSQSVPKNNNKTNVKPILFIKKNRINKLLLLAFLSNFMFEFYILK